MKQSTDFLSDSPRLSRSFRADTNPFKANNVVEIANILYYKKLKKPVAVAKKLFERLGLE